MTDRPESRSGQQASRRRRRSSSSSSPSDRKRTTDASIRRAARVVAVSAAVLFIVFSAQRFRSDLMFFGEHWRAETKPETLYGFNKPSEVRAGGTWLPVRTVAEVPRDADMWRYRNPSGTTTDIEYDGQGVARSLSCWGAASAMLGCPKLFGVSLGTREDDVVAMLGLPARQEFRGPIKAVSYPELGFSLELSEFVVTRITASPLDGRGGAWLRYLRWAIP